MRDAVPRIYTIGQTPRPELERAVAERLGATRFDMVGALDELSQEHIPACGPGGYPLETRLRNGARVVVDMGFVQDRLQAAIAGRDGDAAVHLVCCAGTFPALTARGTLVRPFDAAVAALAARGARSLEVVVPFAAQAAQSARKWEASGFACRVHALDEETDRSSIAPWLATRVAATGSDALVFDYVGFPAALLRRVAAALDIPVVDLGGLGLETLARRLHRP